MPPKIFGALPKKFGEQKNITFMTTFFATSALDTAYLRNETTHWQTNIPVSICNMSPTSWLTFRDLWPRNSWDLLARLDPPMKIQHFSNFYRKKSASKFLCVKTSSGSVVATSFPYLIWHVGRGWWVMRRVDCQSRTGLIYYYLLSMAWLLCLYTVDWTSGDISRCSIFLVE